MADTDLEIREGGGGGGAVLIYLPWRRGGGGLDLLAMAAIFPSVISSFFTQNKGGEGGPGPSPRSATDECCPVQPALNTCQVYVVAYIRKITPVFRLVWIHLKRVLLTVGNYEARFSTRKINDKI